MRIQQQVLPAALLLCAFFVSAGAQEARTTKHLIGCIEEEVTGVTLQKSGAFTYFIGAEKSGLFIIADGAPGGNLYEYQKCLGILQPPGGAPAVALLSMPDALRAYQIDPIEGSIDEHQPLWTKPPVDYRVAVDFANQPSSSFIVLEDYQTKRFDVVNFQNGEVVWSIDRGRTEISGCASHLVASPDGNKVFIGQMFFPPSSDGTINLIHRENPDSVVRAPTINQAISGASFSPNGEVVACQFSPVANARFDASSSGKIRFFDGNDLTDILTISDDFTSMRRIGFSPDGTKLGVLTGPDFRVYDVATGLRLDLIPIPNDDGLCFDFTADGTKVAIGTQAGKIDLIDLILVPPMTEPTETHQ